MGPASTISLPRAGPGAAHAPSRPAGHRDRRAVPRQRAAQGRGIPQHGATTPGVAAAPPSQYYEASASTGDPWVDTGSPSAGRVAPDVPAQSVETGVWHG